MAETLGSLIDKLTIKSIREFYLNKMIKFRKSDFSLQELKGKKTVLKKQQKDLAQEIDDFISSAAKNKLPLRDEKLKLYNKPGSIGRIGKISTVAQAISKLGQKNLELWQLEDHARRTDVPLEYVGKVKRRIDLANQQRNDLIDKIDELFEKRIRR